MFCVFGFSCFNNIPFVTRDQVEGAGDEFLALSQAQSIEIGPGLVTVITIILQYKY